MSDVTTERPLAAPNLIPSPRPGAFTNHTPIPHSVIPAAQDEPGSDAAEETKPVPAKNKGGRPPKSAVGRDHDKNLLRRAFTRYEAIREADPQTRAFLAACWQADHADTASVTLAVVIATGEPTAVRDLRSVTETGDPIDAAVTAAGLDHVRLRAVWAALSALGVTRGEAPSSDAKAARALVRAIHEFGWEKTRTVTDRAISATRA